MIGLVPYWRDALPDTAFVSPNAPLPCPGVAYGYQWWPLSTLSLEERAAGVRAASPILDAFIDQELARHGLTEDRLALVGFSQGTMLALAAAPRRERAIAGVLGYSGMLADETGLSQARSKPPVLLVHGDADEVLPIAAFHHAKAALERQGFPLETHVSRGLGHSIDMPGLQLGGAFLKRVLG